MCVRVYISLCAYFHVSLFVSVYLPSSFFDFIVAELIPNRFVKPRLHGSDITAAVAHWL